MMTLRFRFRVIDVFITQSQMCILQISRDSGDSWEDADSYTAAIAADKLNGEGVTI